MGTSSMDTIAEGSFKRYPPATGLDTALGGTQLNLLATKTFADPDSGFAAGLVLHANLPEADSGRFTLVSGSMTSFSAASLAAEKVETIQGLLGNVQERLSHLVSPNFTEIEKDRQRLLLRFDLEDISKAIDSADYEGFNLLDATQSRGIKLTLSTGELEKLGTTANENIVGTDQTFYYDEDSLSYQTLDLREAFSTLNELQVLTYPDAPAADSSHGNFYSVQRFQAVVDQARDGLSAFKKKLTQMAVDSLTISTEPGVETVRDGFEARQIASRIAQQLANDHSTITANPALRYFSLFG